MCEPCWRAFSLGAFGELATPTRIPSTERQEEECCLCNEPTIAGIVVRVDPSKVPWPRARA